jgi:short-subunit dehydrogenase
VALDLTAASALQLLFDQLQRDGVLVNILVNNAAYGVSGEFAQIKGEDGRRGLSHARLRVQRKSVASI